MILRAPGIPESLAAVKGMWMVPGIDKLERLKLLQNDPLVREFDISVKEPETVSRFLGKFNFKTTQMFREINFKVLKNYF